MNELFSLECILKTSCVKNNNKLLFLTAVGQQIVE